MLGKCAIVLAVALACASGASAKGKKFKHKRPPVEVLPYPAPVVVPGPPPPAYPPYPEAYPVRPLGRKDLERHVKHALKFQLGHCVKDVDVEADLRRGRVEVEVELRHPGAYGQVHQLLYSMPELRGFRIRIDVDD
jgi:hypothetical protein